MNGAGQGVTVLAGMAAVCWWVYRLAYRRLREGLARRGLVRLNVAGRRVPTAGGLLLAVQSLAAQAAGTLLALVTGAGPLPLKTAVLLACGSLAMASFGFLDDCSPEKEVKGFRGHWSTLVREMRVTSGGWKALGGGGTALIVAVGLSRDWGEALLDGAVLALAANAVNLFDVRPGRALKVYGLVAVPLLAASVQAVPDGGWLWLLPPLLSAAFLFVHDARGEIMLGDTGANFLGFSLGGALITVLPPGGKWAAFLLLLGLNALAEWVSFSRLIESVRILRFLDQWGSFDAYSSSSVRRMNRG